MQKEAVLPRSVVTGVFGESKYVKDIFGRLTKSYEEMVGSRTSCLALSVSGNVTVETIVTGASQVTEYDICQSQSRCCAVSSFKLNVYKSGKDIIEGPAIASAQLIGACGCSFDRTGNLIFVIMAEAKIDPPLYPCIQVYTSHNLTNIAKIDTLGHEVHFVTVSACNRFLAVVNFLGDVQVLDFHIDANGADCEFHQSVAVFRARVLNGPAIRSKSIRSCVSWYPSAEICLLALPCGDGSILFLVRNPTQSSASEDDWVRHYLLMNDTASEDCVLTAAAFSPSGFSLCTVDENNCILIWAFRKDLPPKSTVTHVFTAGIERIRDLAWGTDDSGNPYLVLALALKWLVYTDVEHTNTVRTAAAGSKEALPDTTSTLHSQTYAKDSRGAVSKAPVEHGGGGGGGGTVPALPTPPPGSLVTPGLAPGSSAPPFAADRLPGAETNAGSGTGVGSDGWHPSSTGSGASGRPVPEYPLGMVPLLVPAAWGRSVTSSALPTGGTSSFRTSSSDGGASGLFGTDSGLLSAATPAGQVHVPAGAVLAGGSAALVPGNVLHTRMDDTRGRSAVAGALDPNGGVGSVPAFPTPPPGSLVTPGLAPGSSAPPFAADRLPGAETNAMDGRGAVAGALDPNGGVGSVPALPTPPPGSLVTPGLAPGSSAPPFVAGMLPGAETNAMDGRGAVAGALEPNGGVGSVPALPTPPPGSLVTPGLAPGSSAPPFAADRLAGTKNSAESGSRSWPSTPTRCGSSSPQTTCA